MSLIPIHFSTFDIINTIFTSIYIFFEVQRIEMPF